MALEFYVKLQSPTIELKIDVKDASGECSSILVGFKRYEDEEAAEKLKEFQSILDTTQESGNLSSSNLKQYLKDEIVYIKKIILDTVDNETGKKGVLKIEDTRTAASLVGFWDSADSCLDVLTERYLSSGPWKLALIDAAIRATLNTSFKEDEVKN